MIERMNMYYGAASTSNGSARAWSGRTSRDHGVMDTGFAALALLEHLDIHGLGQHHNRYV